jgi:ankyrin repeat protein
MGKALALFPDHKPYQIVDARLAALLGDPNGPSRVKNSDSFDFKGNVSPKKAEDKVQTTGTPLFEAAENGDLAAVRTNIATSDINQISGKYKQTPLMVAAQAGFLPIVEELLEGWCRLGYC